jgi:carbonic anhydrase/acetyltransferase-like protein (isoleucine patch superfamily)
MSGITIGDGAVVAANSNVVKDIGEYEVWGGNPAKFIKHRFDDEIIDKLLSIKWWDCSIQKVKRIAPLLSQSPDMKVLEQVAKIASNEE